MKMIVLCALIGSAFASDFRDNGDKEPHFSNQYSIKGIKHDFDQCNEKDEEYSFGSHYQNRGAEFGQRKEDLKEYTTKKSMTLFDKRLKEETYGPSSDQYIHERYTEETKDSKRTMERFTIKRITSPGKIFRDTGYKEVIESEKHEHKRQISFIKSPPKRLG